MTLDRHRASFVVASLMLAACTTVISFTAQDGGSRTSTSGASTGSGSIMAGPTTGGAVGAGGSAIPRGDAAGNGEAGADCDVSFDCDRPLVCVDRRCRLPCEASVQCPDGQRCVMVPAGPVCLSPDEPFCRDSSDCTPGFVCSPDGRCRGPCMNDNGCTSGLKCIAGYCQLPATDAGDASTESPTVEQACAEDATSWCEPLSRCAPLTLQELFGDTATCTTRAALSCRARLRAVGTSLTPARVQMCARADALLSCDAFLYSYVAPEACTILPGALPDGANCYSAAQCQSTYCKAPLGGACGICAPRSPVGGPCARHDDCIDRYCSRSDMKCGEVPDLGQPCTLVCKGDLTCARPSTGGEGVCRKPLGADAPCDPSQDACDRSWNGLGCDPQSRTCVARERAAAPGESCEVDRCRAGSCFTETDAGSICVGFVPDNQPCQLPNCTWPAECVDSVCTLPNFSACP